MFLNGGRVVLVLPVADDAGGHGRVVEIDWQIDVGVVLVALAFHHCLAHYYLLLLIHSLALLFSLFQLIFGISWSR